MTRHPEFITFTGVDDATDIHGMFELQKLYPVEWAILLSRSRQGLDPRYPKDPERFLSSPSVLAGHLCGSYAREVMAGLHFNLPDYLPAFQRVQVNHPEPNPTAVAALQRALGRGAHCIAQARSNTFPVDDSIRWLFDRSGGTGAAPTIWPCHPGGERLVGYAGGIGPENVREVLAAIGSTGPYWIDMESGVRTGDRFDLAKCRAVLEAVYGRASSALEG